MRLYCTTSRFLEFNRFHLRFSTEKRAYSRLMILLAAIALTACNPAPKYQTTPDGSKWRLLAFGKQEAKLDSARVIYMNGFVLDQYHTDTLRSFYNEPFIEKDSDGLWEVLKMHFSGDSIEYISVSADFLHPETYVSDTLVYFLHIDRMRTAAQVEDDKFKELTRLDSLIRTDSLKSNYTEYKGVYLRSLIKTDTATVRNGREVLLQYRGATLSGKVFDDSRRMEGPLRFVMGNDHQVLPGIELALEKMHRKEQMRVIIPSWLAYGARGSAGGHVPPYTTVVYDLEVLQLGE